MSNNERITSAKYRFVCGVYRCTLDVILSKLDDLVVLTTFLKNFKTT